MSKKKEREEEKERVHKYKSIFQFRIFVKTNQMGGYQTLPYLFLNLFSFERIYDHLSE